VDPHLCVGGPATSNFYLDPEVLKKGIAAKVDLQSLLWHPIWIDEILRCFHKNNLPVDFISTHPYPMDFKANGRLMHRSVNSTRDGLELLRKLVAAGLLETPRSLWSSRSRCEAIHFMADLSNKEARQQCS
jgi:xylan 1,4-beta-xylosidase